MAAHETEIKAIQALQAMQEAKQSHPRGWLRRFLDIDKVLIQFPYDHSSTSGTGRFVVDISHAEYDYLLHNNFIREHPMDDTFELTIHGEELASARIERED